MSTRFNFWFIFFRIGGGSLLRWATAARWKSVDSTTTVEEDARESQRLKDEETAYENDIKARILDASLLNVPQLGWSKEALAIGELLF